MHIAHKLVLPSFFFLFVWLFFPFVYSIYVSFFRFVLVRPELFQFIGFGNYTYLFSSQDFAWAFRQTFLYMAVILAIELPLGLAVALLLSRDFRGVGVLRVVAGLPILAIPAGTSLLWKNMFQPGVGYADVITKFLGLGVVDWWGDYLFSSILVILIDVWQWTPFVTLILLAAILSLPREPYEAAKIDGLSAWMTFTKITLPLLRPVIIIVGILRTLDLIKLMEPIMVISRGGYTTTLSFYVWKAVFKSMDIGLGGAFSVVFWITVWLLSNILLRIFKGVTK